MTTVEGAAHVLVGVDGSESSQRAVRWAADAAARRGQHLLLAHIIDFRPGYASATTPRLELGRMPQEFVDAVHEHAASITDDARDAAMIEHPELRTQVTTSIGSPGDDLLRLSSDSTLTVLGATGRGGFTRMLLGSVALAVVSRSQGPVVVVRAGDDGIVPTTGPVVVGVDGGPRSDAALAAACEEAALRGSDLVAVMAWELAPTELPLGRWVPAGTGFAAARVTEERVLAERLAGWQDSYPDLRVARVFEDGDPKRALLEAAADAQLVVVGSRGHGEVTGLLLGSVSRALIHHAPCPVLVARGHRRT